MMMMTMVTAKVFSAFEVVVAKGSVSLDSGMARWLLG